MRALFLSLFFLVSGTLATFAAEFEIKDLSGGMWSNPSSNRIQDNSASLIQNFFTDVEPIAIERNGFEKRDTTVLGDPNTVEGLWEFVDNSANQWIISFSSRSFYRNLIGDNPVKFGPTMTVGQIPECVSNLGKFMCVNGTDSAWTYDGTSTAAVAGAPLGKLIVPWRNRFVISNITASQSTVRFSADGDETSWTLAGNASDPFSIQIGGANDGFNVTCLWGSYLDNLIIARKRDIWAVAGFDQLDIVTRNVSSEIGCIQNGSMQEFDGSLIFLSNRGLEEMRGAIIKHISEPIRDITDVIVGNTISERRNIQTSAADWAAGTSTPTLNLNSTFLSGSLSSITTTFSLTTSDDFTNNGTVTDNVLFSDTVTVSGQIQTTFPDFFTSYRDGTSGTLQLWSDEIGAILASPTLTNEVGVTGGVLDVKGKSSNGNFKLIVNTLQKTHDISSGVTFYFDIDDISACQSPCPTTGSGDSNLYFGISQSSHTWSISATSFNPTSTPDYWWLLFVVEPSASVITFEKHRNDDTINNSIATTHSIPATVAFWLDSSNFNIEINGSVEDSGSHTWSTNPIFPAFLYRNTGTSIGTRGAEIDDFVVNPQTFTYTTTWDTEVSSAVWGTLSATLAGNVNFGVQASDDNSTFDSEIFVGSGSVVTSDAKRYIKINTQFNDDRSSFPGTVSANIQDLSLTAGTTGTFTSQVFSIGNAISSWGPVGINDEQVGGSITYQFNSTDSADINDFDSGNWETLTSGQVPTISTASFAAFRADLNIDAATHTVSIADFTTTWNEGDIQQTASWVHNRRYWIAFTTNTASDSRNNSVLVYQRNRTFSVLDGINSASFATWRDNLYFGDAEDNGFVYKYDVGDNDDGSDINSRIEFKSYDLGLFNQDKDFRNLYVNYKSGNSGSLSVTYELDRDGNSYSLGSANMNEETGQVNAKFPFSLSNPVQGRELQYTLTKNGTGDRLKLYDLKTVFSVIEAR